MSEAQAITSAHQQIEFLPFEQQIFARSPFGIVTTIVVIFVLFFGAFLVVADIEHVAIVRPGFAPTGASWPAVVLSLVCCAALGMQRYVRVAEAKDAPAYAKILTGGTASVVRVTSMGAPEARLGRATLIGLLVGLAISAIDLLRTDTLAVLGRSAARSSLIWFVVSAVAFLFLVGGDLNWLTSLLIVACAAMGIIQFAIVMSRVHKLIMQAKAQELEHIRRQIEMQRSAMTTDDHAATRLHGLLAYEKRITEAPEWPFDQTTLLRVGASTLILTVPWFGQAIAAYVVDHLSHFAG